MSQELHYWWTLTNKLTYWLTDQQIIWPADQPSQPANHPTDRPTDQPTNQQTHWPPNWPTNHLHQAEPFLRSYLLLTGTTVQWSRGVTGVPLHESIYTSHIQCRIAAAPEKTLVLLASLLSCFRCYHDPEFSHNDDWEVPYWPSGGTAPMSKTTNLKL
jgi:hypothetical protein